MRVLVVAEHDNQSLKAGVLNTLQAARNIASEVVVLVAGHQASSVAQAAAQVEGVSKVLHADAPQYAHALAENIANLVLSIAQEYTHILTPASTFGKNFLPRVAALLDVAQVSDVIQVVDAETFVRDGVPIQFQPVAVETPCHMRVPDESGGVSDILETDLGIGQRRVGSPHADISTEIG